MCLHMTLIVPSYVLAYRTLEVCTTVLRSHTHCSYSAVAGKVLDTLNSPHLPRYATSFARVIRVVIRTQQRQVICNKRKLKNQITKIDNFIGINQSPTVSNENEIISTIPIGLQLKDKFFIQRQITV